METGGACHSCGANMKVFLIDRNQLDELWDIHLGLCGGTEREREFSQRVRLLYHEVRLQEFSADEYDKLSNTPNATPTSSEIPS